jgi:hypothetical protein
MDQFLDLAESGAAGPATDAYPLKIQGKIQSGGSSQFYNLNYVENWKWTQWEKLFRMINYSTMPSFNIFGHREDHVCEF